MLINLSIELTDLCNARCNYCVIGIENGRPPHHNQRMGFIEVEDFRRVFDGLHGFLRDPVCMPVESIDLCVRLCGIGEPTLHPRFVELFHIALQHPDVKQLTVVSNGSGLPPDRTRALAELLPQHPDVLVDFLLGLDAADPAVQYRVKRIANVSKIAADLDAFLELKIRAALPNLKFIFQIIVTDENRDHVKPFCEFWESRLRAKSLRYALTADWGYLDRMHQFDAFIWVKRRDADGPDQPHFDELHRSALRDAGLEPQYRIQGLPNGIVEARADARYQQVCGLFWYGININAGGEVSPCCIDDQFQLNIGNIKQASLQDMYRGETMQRYREAHLTRDFRTMPLCAGCQSIHKYKPVAKEAIQKYQDALASCSAPS